MKTPTWPLSTLPSRPSHCRCTPTEARPLLGEARGVEDDDPVAGADLTAHLAGQLAQQGPMVPGRGADEVLEAVPLLVMAVGDRLGGLVLQVGDEPGQVGPGVVALLAADQALGERPGEVGEAFEAALEDLGGNLAFVEQLLLAEPVTPVHRSPPGGRIDAGRLSYITPWLLSTKFRQPKYLGSAPHIRPMVTGP